MSVLNDAKLAKEALEKVIDNRIDIQTRDCMRLYKARVISPANENTKVMGVQLIQDTAEMELPYTKAVANAQAGDIVWVATIYGSWRNAIVFANSDFDIGGSGIEIGEVVQETGDSETAVMSQKAVTDELARKFGFITFSNNPNTLLQDLRTAMGTDNAMVSLTGYQTGYYFVRFAYYGGTTYNVIASNLAELYRYSLVGNITTMTFMDLFSSANKQSFQPEDGDLTAIAELTGTSGFLKKTGENTWELVEGGATGNGISSITKTATEGLVDTYTITFTDGTTTTFTVTNGENATTTEVATTTTNGLMSAEDKTELDRLTGIAVDKISHINFSGEEVHLQTVDNSRLNFSYNDVIIRLSSGKQYSISADIDIPIVAGDNITFEQDETENVVKINGQGFSDISYIDTWMDTPYNLDYAGTDGIAWKEEAEIIGTNGDTLWYGHIAHRIPIMAGNGISFEPVAAYGSNPDVVKINATGGGSSLTMPIIRMGSATDTNNTMEISDDNPLTFTVEVIGGELQVGDELQLCAMKLFTYANKETDDGSRIRKYKMRQFAKYTITEEDLSKRYLSIAVAGEVERRELLRGGGTTTSTVHNYYTKYLRIRRTHPDNPDNNALFSNAVPFQVFGKWDRETTNSVGKVSIR